MRSLVAYLLAIGLMIFLGLWLAHYKYEECRKVGHSWFYCAVLNNA